MRENKGGCCCKDRGPDLIKIRDLVVVFAVFSEAYSTPLAGLHLTTQLSEMQQGPVALPHGCRGSGDSQCRLPGMGPPTLLTHLGSSYLAAWQPRSLVGGSALSPCPAHAPSLLFACRECCIVSGRAQVGPLALSGPMLTMGSVTWLLPISACLSVSSLLCQQGNALGFERAVKSKGKAELNVSEKSLNQHSVHHGSGSPLIMGWRAG